ncbi:hypothetical protein [Frankia sp. AgB32]|uniref:hypothetical protein n=1 Tax=Frankia sp. AgB32 TaxID=631119 RepID=UPI00200FA4B0|nr:hypothetical protein [Frankia sp. AgB32]MCK9896064.1 hypothetical protein [Frankia sp. AgB32]
MVLAGNDGGAGVGQHRGEVIDETVGEGRGLAPPATRWTGCPIRRASSSSKCHPASAGTSPAKQ